MNLEALLEIMTDCLPNLKWAETPKSVVTSLPIASKCLAGAQLSLDNNFRRSFREPSKVACSQGGGPNFIIIKLTVYSET